VLAIHLVGGAVAACKEKTYNVTAVVLDIDGVRQAMLRGDDAGIATLRIETISLIRNLWGGVYDIILCGP
jgi:uncharacterized protein GlcG (DUF336 family)